jgi:adenylate kinase family enzyme
MRMVFFDSPVSGRCTYAAEIARQYKPAGISTGELFRDEVLEGSSVGRGIGCIFPEGKAAKRLALLKSRRQRNYENCLRTDDEPEVIHHRFKFYRQETAPLIMQGGDGIVTVSGTGSTPLVSGRTLKEL